MQEYQNWRTDPSPENMNALMEALAPVINSEVHRYAGPKQLLRSQARILAAKAIRTFDPTHGAQLRSWIVTQLQPLSRYSQQLKPVYIPETAIRQGAELNRLRLELTDELGREPEDEELADETGISVARIRSLREKIRPSMHESALMQNDDENSVASLPAIHHPDTMGLAQEVVLSSIPEADRRIFDLKTGLGDSATPMANKDIASMLNITPARVSQRSKAIADQINSIVTKGWV